jgi:hypothetical protein
MAVRDRRHGLSWLTLRHFFHPKGYIRNLPGKVCLDPVNDSTGINKK